METGIYYELDKLNVYVKKSTIPSAGNGLFAKRNFKKGEVVCRYEGPLLTPQEAAQKNPLDGSYLLQCDFNWDSRFGNDDEFIRVIDASNQKSCYGRYCNDDIFSNGMVSPGDCLYMKNENWGILELNAKRKIAKNEEIFFSYGVDYWMEPERVAHLEAAEIAHLRRNRSYDRWYREHVETSTRVHALEPASVATPVKKRPNQFSGVYHGPHPRQWRLEPQPAPPPPVKRRSGASREEAIIL